MYNLNVSIKLWRITLSMFIITPAYNISYTIHNTSVSTAWCNLSNVLLRTLRVVSLVVVVRAKTLQFVGLVTIQYHTCM